MARWRSDGSAKAVRKDGWRLNSLADQHAQHLKGEGNWQRAFPEEHVIRLRSLVGDIEGLQLEVPAHVVDAWGSASDSVLRALLISKAAELSVSTEVLAATREGRPFDGGKVIEHWTLIERPNLPGKPEWSDAQRGALLKEADKACAELFAQVEEHVRRSS